MEEGGKWLPFGSSQNTSSGPEVEGSGKGEDFFFLTHCQHQRLPSHSWSDASCLSSFSAALISLPEEAWTWGPRQPTAHSSQETQTPQDVREAC